MNTVTYEGIVKYMNSMEFSGMKLGIDRIKTALELFGNPEQKLKIINIVGTNGKGSVAAMMSQILHDAGHKVGMFTSPHLVDVRERIQVGGQMISKQEFREVFLEAKSKLADLTFFELVTLMAVLHFVNKKVEYALFEAGLGGRYDATNFDTGEMTIITKVSLDHTDILGSTVEQIAKDKCGMIKKGQPVVVTHANNGLMGLIRQAAAEKDATLIMAKDTDYELSLKGSFQKENAGIAVQAAKELRIDEETVKKSLRKVKWPGRVEFIEKNVLLDCAHNPGGIEALRRYVETLKYDRLFIIFAVSNNKDYKEMLRRLPEHHELIFTQTSVARRLSIDEVPDDIECTKIREPIKALQHAKSLAGEKDLILVCGSIFLIGDVKSSQLAHVTVN
ncbi:MAG: bifunctional folylpolyglutamate synthase/dihydrofolate synthase [Nanoarchaeota archaeon]|nr:bifunctional folylpolyglutamate synthase/dihydrofolate synthase [Nanoarchaeota archaeon]